MLKTMPKTSKLPPLPDEVFDGYKEKREIDFSNKCTHRNVKVVGSELQCTCGAGWIGGNIATLHNLMSNRT